MEYSKEELVHILKTNFPEATIVSDVDMRNLHKHDTTVAGVIAAFHLNARNYINYRLPEHMYGSRKGWCCNGIIYGPEDEYMSLPQIETNPVDKTLQE